MDDQQVFIIGVCGSGRPVEAACDHRFVVDHCELVVELVAVSKAWCADAFLLQWF